jgi:hypothetical protein
LNNLFREFYSTDKFDEFNNQIDKIAESNKDKWIIFSEWKYMTSRDEFKEYILEQMETFFNRSGFVDELLRTKRYPVNRKLFRQVLERATDDDVDYDEIYDKEVLTEYCLGLNHYLNKRHVFEHEYIITPGSDSWFIRKFFPYNLKNKKLYEFIVTQLNTVYKHKNERYKMCIDYSLFVPPYGKRSKKTRLVIEEDKNGSLKLKRKKYSNI